MKQPIVGVWQLVSFEIEKPPGHRQPWGTAPYGTLIYTACGWVSVSINDQHPAPPKDERGWLRSLIFYSGTYELVADQVVHHHVRNASHADLLGCILNRATLKSRSNLTLAPCRFPSPPISVLIKRLTRHFFLIESGAGHKI